MALYDPVDGVYRKVTKKYDPVDGVYRAVKKAYDPVDGIYRQYFSSGVPWKKYNCTKKTTDNSQYYLGAQKSISGEWDTSGAKSYTGYSDYTFDRKAGTVYASGAQTTVSKANPGAVYEGGGQTIYGYAARSDGYYHTFSRTVVYEVDITVIYTIGSLFGTVYTAEEEYPDASNGYTYEDTYSGYTIMRDPNTNKIYAYLKEE